MLHPLAVFFGFFGFFAPRSIEPLKIPLRREIVAIQVDGAFENESRARDLTVRPIRQTQMILNLRSPGHEACGAF